MKGLVIGLDFDGTCVEHEYPAIGRELDNCINTIKRTQESGARIILYTMRHEKPLEEAVAWLKERGVELWGVNVNPGQKHWSQSPKVYAHIYIDDAALGCPLTYPETGRPYVDWMAVEDLLFNGKLQSAEVIHR